MSFKVKSKVNLIMGSKQLTLEANESIKLNRTVTEDILVEDAQGNRALFKTQKEAVKFLHNIKNESVKSELTKVPLIKLIRECKSINKLADFLVLTEQLDDEVLDKLDAAEIIHDEDLQDKVADKMTDPEGGLEDFEVEVPTKITADDTLEGKLEILTTESEVDDSEVTDELIVDDVDILDDIEDDQESDSDEDYSDDSEDDFELDMDVMEESIKRIKRESVEVRVSAGDEVTVQSEPAQPAEDQDEEPTMPVLGDAPATNSDEKEKVAADDKDEASK